MNYLTAQFLALRVSDKALSWLWEIVEDREAWHAVVHGGCKESDIT